MEKTRTSILQRIADAISSVFNDKNNNIDNTLDESLQSAIEAQGGDNKKNREKLLKILQGSLDNSPKDVDETSRIVVDQVEVRGINQSASGGVGKGKTEQVQRSEGKEIVD